MLALKHMFTIKGRTENKLDRLIREFKCVYFAKSSEDKVRFVLALIIFANIVLQEAII